MNDISASERIAILERRLRRATVAREEAESILERRSRELVYLNEKLSAREDELVRRLGEETQHLLYAQRTAEIATFHRKRGEAFFASPEFNRLLGLPADQRPNEQALLQVIHPLDRERMLRAEKDFYQHAPANTEMAYECRILKAGEKRWLRWVMRRENDDEGLFLYVFGSVQDITGQRRADRHARAMALIADRRVKQLTRVRDELAASRQEAEQAYRAKSQFLAMMSHDIRTPLNGLLGMTDMLALGELNAAQRERLDVAHEAATQLHRQIEDIVAMARGEGSDLDYEPQPVSIRHSLNNMVRFWCAGQPDVGARLRLTLSNTLPEAVASDPTRLRHLLDAFIERLRGPEAEIEIHADADPQHVRIAVGCLQAGIESHDRRSAERHILNRLAESMGARIDVQRDVGSLRYVLILANTPMPGATTTPAAEEHDYSPEREIAAAAEIAPLRCAGRRPVVLVVDDVEINRFVLVQMLDALGCDVDTAADGRQAVDCALQSRYDIILMDIRMPVMSGTEAMRVLRACGDTRTERLPIVAVTAHADPAELAELVEQGFNAALGKPVQLSRIATTLQTLLACESDGAGASPHTPEAGAVSPTDQIDSGHFMSIFGPLPPERRRMLLDVAVADFERLGGAIATAVDNDSAAALDQASHSLKGVAGNFGAFALMDTLAMLRRMDMAEARVALPALQNQIEAVIEQARALFEANEA